jgi:phosphotransacetylase
MKTKSYLEKLKAKPEPVRRSIAFWTSFAITLIIMAFWVASITGVTDTTASAIANTLQKTGTPAQSLMASAGGLFDDIKDIFFSPKKFTYSSVEVKAGK